jgi:hypothetical protein
MSVRNSNARGQGVSEHIVQFFDSDESRARNVAAFLAAGYAAGDTLIVVARPVIWAALIEQLEVLGVPVDVAVASGRLVIKDAADTLRNLSRGGSPNRELFDQVVGRTVRALAGRGRVRAYGEMVDMLAQEGELDDAIALEGFWNELSARTPIFLMCGYSAAHFVSSATHRALLDICKTHSNVRRDDQDPLGTWLLNAAHNTPVAIGTLRH